MRLRHLRTDRGVTQKQLSAACGIDQSAISRIENGKQEVSVRQLLKLAEALAVEPAALLADAPGPVDQAA